MSEDIVERLQFDSARCEMQFSKGVAMNIEEAAAEITRLRSRAEQAEARVRELEVGLQQALRQWRIYADNVERNDGFDLATEKSAEGDLYRHLTAALRDVPR